MQSVFHGLVVAHLTSSNTFCTAASSWMSRRRIEPEARLKPVPVVSYPASVKAEWMARPRRPVAPVTRARGMVEGVGDDERLMSLRKIWWRMGWPWTQLILVRGLEVSLSLHRLSVCLLTGMSTETLISSMLPSLGDFVFSIEFRQLIMYWVCPSSDFFSTV